MKTIGILIFTFLAAGVVNAKTAVKQKRNVASSGFTRTCRVDHGASFYVKFNGNKVPYESGLKIDIYDIIEQETEGSTFISHLMADQKTREIHLSVDAKLLITIKTPISNTKHMTGTVKLANRQAMNETVLNSTTDLEDPADVAAEADRVIATHPNILTSGLSSAHCIEKADSN